VIPAGRSATLCEAVGTPRFNLGDAGLAGGRQARDLRERYARKRRSLNSQFSGVLSRPWAFLTALVVRGIGWFGQRELLIVKRSRKLDVGIWSHDERIPIEEIAPTAAILAAPHDRPHRESGSSSTRGALRAALDPSAKSAPS